MAKVLELINYGSTELSSGDAHLRTGMISILQCLQINIYLPQAKSDKTSHNMEVANTKMKSQNGVHLARNMAEEIVDFEMSYEPDFISNDLIEITEMRAQNEDMTSYNVPEQSIDSIQRIEKPNLVVTPERGLTAMPKTVSEIIDANNELPMPYR